MSARAIVRSNGLVFSWMVIVVNEKCETERVLATGLTRSASEAIASQWNEARAREQTKESPS